MQEHTPEHRLLTAGETATLLNIPEQTLRRWRSQRINLPYIHVGRSVRYRYEDLREWLNRNTIPAADETQGA